MLVGVFRPGAVACVGRVPVSLVGTAAAGSSISLRGGPTSESLEPITQYREVGHAEFVERAPTGYSLKEGDLLQVRSGHPPLRSDWLAACWRILPAMIKEPFSS